MEIWVQTSTRFTAAQATADAGNGRGCAARLGACARAGAAAAAPLRAVGAAAARMGRAAAAL
ncbi:MAG: hypothetical protein ACO3QY_08170, partial [Burkholderiaceae bacterium]